MNTEISRVIKRNVTPAWVVVLEYAAGALGLIVGGIWWWRLASHEQSFGVATAMGVFFFGAGLISDANSRAAVNRVLSDVRGAVGDVAATFR